MKSINKNNTILFHSFLDLFFFRILFLSVFIFSHFSLCNVIRCGRASSISAQKPMVACQKKISTLYRMYIAYRITHFKLTRVHAHKHTNTIQPITIWTNYIGCLHAHFVFFRRFNKTTKRHLQQWKGRKTWWISMCGDGSLFFPVVRANARFLANCCKRFIVSTHFDWMFTCNQNIETVPTTVFLLQDVRHSLLLFEWNWCVWFRKKVEKKSEPNIKYLIF